MAVYILQNERQIGPLEDAEVLAGLQSGVYSPNDHGWREGMANRVPLSVLFPPSQPWAITQPVTEGAAPPRLGEDAGMRLLLPVGQSGWAIAAGYLGLFSLLVLPAPLALLSGLLALREINKSITSGPRKHGTGRAVFGVIMGVLGTTALFLVVFLWRR